MVMHIKKPENEGTLLREQQKKKKIQKKDLNKIEASFVEGKQKMNSLKVKREKCLNVKGKFNNMEQLQMEY